MGLKQPPRSHADGSTKLVSYANGSPFHATVEGVFHELAVPKLARGFGWAKLYERLEETVNGTSKPGYTGPNFGVWKTRPQG